MSKEEIGIIDGDALFKKMRELRTSHLTSMTMMELYLRECRVPIQPQARTDVRSSERIEAAIRELDKSDKVLGNLLQWALTGEKDQDTWTNKDFGLEEE